MDKLSKFSVVMSNVSRVAFMDVAEGDGLADPAGNRPAQREWACFVDTPEGPQIVCSIYSVQASDGSLRVIAISPYEASKMCTVCEMMDATMDSQAQLDALLTHVLTIADEVEEMTPEDDFICDEAGRFVCDQCQEQHAETEVQQKPFLMLN